jgi:TonB family protein
MNPARSRKLLVTALAISLLLHLLFAGYLRWPFLRQSPEEPQIAKVHITRIARIIPHTPPPTPAPTPVATPRVQATIVPPTITNRGKGPAIAKTLPIRARTPRPAPATAAPTPVARLTPSGPCAGHANADAALAATPDAADISPEARAAKVTGTAAVHVMLDPQGHVIDASVAQSSGNAGLDASAVQMARNASYTPKYVACKAVAGDYTFTVKFSAW